MNRLKRFHGMPHTYDAIIIGSGPNGLAAAIALAQKALSVLVVEAKDTIGGGTRTTELTLPGFKHDVCSAVHPMGVLSPFFQSLPLEEHGLTWLHPPASVAHPLDDGSAVLLEQSLDRTMANLGADDKAWQHLIAPFLRKPDVLLRDLLAPLGIPEAPFQMARFGFYGMRSATQLARRFKATRARALLAGCAAHSVLPLTRLPSAAVGLVFAVTGHLTNWPVARGGSIAITQALARYFQSLGGQIETSRPIRTLSDLPEARAILFDTSPNQVVDIAADALPATYVKTLQGYRYGPGAFKVDWALSEPISWRNPRCAEASTVHVGGTLEEIATAEGEAWDDIVPERPFVLVCQQSHFDDTRAPDGQHTGYAYCHVPNGSTVDMTDRIEAQIERFAPGFRDTILARHTISPVDFEVYNGNYVGGAITGGAADLTQLFTRPAARINPYTTPNKRLFLCSASTPPGGGVHGMCGYHAAQAVLKRLGVS